jgi:hypothetical protein
MAAVATVAAFRRFVAWSNAPTSRAASNFGFNVALDRLMVHDDMPAAFLYGCLIKLGNVSNLDFKYENDLSRHFNLNQCHARTSSRKRLLQELYKREDLENRYSPGDYRKVQDTTSWRIHAFPNWTNFVPTRAFQLFNSTLTKSVIFLRTTPKYSE